MQLTMFESEQDSTPLTSSGKTSQASSAPKTTRSGAFWLALPAKMSRFNHQGKNGRTLVVCMDPSEQSHGGPWTPNTSDWPNDAAVCSLSQVLETGSIPPRFFLSGTACAGILRRADKRGKTLPEPLQVALTAVASQEQARPAAGMSSQPADTICGECGEKFRRTDEIRALAPAECPRCGEESNLSPVVQ